MSETDAVGFKLVKCRCSHMPAASRGNCIDMLLVGDEQKDIFRLWSAASGRGKNVSAQSAPTSACADKRGGQKCHGAAA